jgi:hypothetical protein
MALAKESIAELCAGPSIIVIDQLSLYHTLINYRFRMLDKCADHEHVLVAVFAPLSTPDHLLVLRELTEKSATPVIDRYYCPPLPYRSQAIFAVNVADSADAQRLVRYCLARHLRSAVTAPGSAYLGVAEAS